MSDTEDDPGTYPYLQSLNPAQLQAVTAPPATPLQILAGPGSGKTRVLTSRVAHLVKKHGYSPRSITAVTFTNKAAAEMRKRLIVLLGEEQANQLVLGTFHATCAKYLRRYGSLIGLNNSFSIVDADDCKKIMARLIKDRKEQLTQLHLKLKEGAVLSEISKAKAKGETPQGMAARAAKAREKATNDMETQGPDVLHIISELYEEYEISLREADALDFDDLLLYGLRLFTQHPDILKSCRHILVDEFQDTNTTQYELMKCFALANGGVSIVGDPDQSIYGWRSAEVENLDHMTTDFKGVEVICLEENYRSTGAILDASHSIVSQDSGRIKKSLYTSHPQSTAVTLKLFATPVIEASFIATEIKRLIAYSGDMLTYDDFSILLRYNALSRVIESALQKEGIPNRIIGGHKFFERMEIKDLLAYLQLADNPNFTPAFMRVVNVPKRRLGETSVAKIVDAAKKKGVSPMELCQGLVDGEPLTGGITNAVKRDLAPFVGAVRSLRRAALKGLSVREMILLVIKKVKYEEHLRHLDDFEQRWENVQELISYSVIVAEEQERQAGMGLEEALDEGFASAKDLMAKLQEHTTTVGNGPRLHPMFRKSGSDSSISRAASVHVIKKTRAATRVKVKEEDDVIEILSSEDELEQLDNVSASTSPKPENDGPNPLRFFLQSSMLSTDTEVSEEGAHVPKVTISTVHSAKGLEWPVVFIPAVEHGTFPASRCVEEKEIAEERRLLYVAMTRAQLFLTLSHSMSRMLGGDTQERNLSEFVDKSLRRNANIFTSTLPAIDDAVRGEMAVMLGRPAPDQSATKAMILQYTRSAPPLSTWDAPERDRNPFARRDRPGHMSRAFEYWASDADEYAPATSTGSRPGFVAFSSAKSFIPPHTAPPIPKPPVQKLQSSNRNMPAPLPFTFMGEAQRPTANLSSFTAGSSSSLAAMKALGLPEPSVATPPTASSQRRIALPGATASSSSARTTNNSGPGNGGATVGTAGQADGIFSGNNEGAAIPLARGTKRLGMRRPLAPWGSNKRGKME